jgi:transcriptional regulator with XRE-family HTH domain
MRYTIDHPEMINSRRHQLGISLTELARMVGVSSDRILSYEQGRARQMDAPTLTTIAEVLDCDPTLFSSEYRDPDWHLSTAAINVNLIHDYLSRTNTSANQLALEARVNPSIVYGLTRKGRRSCRAISVMKLAKAMGVDPGERSPALAMYPPAEEG